MKKNYYIFIIALLVFAACSGSENEMYDMFGASRAGEDDAPVVTTDSIVYESGSKATAYATLVSEGTSKVINRGLVYSYVVEEPTLGADDCRTRRTSVDSTGLFEVNMVALSIGKTYYVRAYAINATDTAYANTIILNTVETQYIYPTVETLPVLNRVKVAAIAYGQLVSAGTTTITEQGVCISKLPNPTTKDTHLTSPNRASGAGYDGQFGVFFDNLESGAMYHVRAYVIANDSVVYGKDRIFKTSKGGNMTYGWSNYSEAQEKGLYNTITANVQTACDYFNNYSNLSKYEYINYSSSYGTTADSNIEGWVRFCSQYSARTAQHEFAHTVGVGTASNWASKFDSSGSYDGEVTQQTLRAIYRDQTLWVKRSGIHFWPCGLNYDSEVTSGETNNLGVTIKGATVLKANAMVVNAMRIDGLTSY